MRRPTQKHQERMGAAGNIHWAAARAVFSYHCLGAALPRPNLAWRLGGLCPKLRLVCAGAACGPDACACGMLRAQQAAPVQQKRVVGGVPDARRMLLASGPGQQRRRGRQQRATAMVTAASMRPSPGAAGSSPGTSGSQKRSAAARESGRAAAAQRRQEQPRQATDAAPQGVRTEKQRQMGATAPTRAAGRAPACPARSR